MEGEGKYAITKSDARLIRAYQVCKSFNCFDLDVYRRNPSWWNEACYALINTENKVQEEKSR